MAYMYFTFKDYDGEESTVKFHFPDLTDGASWVAANARLTAMQAAVEPLSLGNLVNYGINASNEQAVGAASNQFAQREIKWFVPYQEAGSGDNRHLTIPCADLSKLAVGQKVIDVTDAAWIAFKAELENAFYNTPGGDGDYLVGVAYHVGRNS